MKSQEKLCNSHIIVYFLDAQTSCCRTAHFGGESHPPTDEGKLGPSFLFWCPFFQSPVLASIPYPTPLLIQWLKQRTQLKKKKLITSGANIISDTMGRMPGSPVLIVKGTVDPIKSYREQLEQDAAQHSEIEFLLLSKNINIASCSIFRLAL